METKEKAIENIGIIKEQIDKFDNKANILITIVGIIFAISLSMLDVFRTFESITASYILLLIFTSLYFVFFGFCFSVFRTPRVVKAQPFWGLLGAGVPPFMGTLTPFAYWGALKVLSFPFSVLRFPF